MFNRTKPIRQLFPNKEVAREMIRKGVQKYKHSTTFVLTDKWPNGKLLGKIYITPALAALMYATGKEPKAVDINTPAQTYGWNYNDTRDLISALEGLAKGNDWYWNNIYGDTAIITPVKSVAV